MKKSTKKSTAPYDITLSLTPSTHPLGYTPLELIHGSVQLTIRKTLNLNCIEVEILGESISWLNIKKRDKNNGKPKVTQVEERHGLLKIGRIVFPDGRDRDVRVETFQSFDNGSGSSTPEYILGPGSYEFEFQLEIPLNCQCFNIDLQQRRQQARKSSSSSLLSQLSISAHNTNSASEMNPDQSVSHALVSLPPSLNGPDDFYYIHYLITATIYRPTKSSQYIRQHSDQNITLSQPLRLVPFTPIKYHNEEYSLTSNSSSSQTFIRKQAMFNEKIPEIIAVKYNKSDNIYNQTLSIPSSKVPFGLEVRLKNDGVMALGQSLVFKLFIVSHNNPQRYLNPNGKSSKLGLIILKHLKLTLHSLTEVSSHGISHIDKKRHRISDVRTQGHIDLAYSQLSKSHSLISDKKIYEIQLPNSLYENENIPLNIAPSFQSCHLKRWYVLEISAVFEDPLAEYTSNGSRSKYLEITLDCPLTLISGVEIPRGESRELRRTSNNEVVERREVRRAPPRRLPSYGEATMLQNDTRG
ncbi:hypothetical protein WICPIJ_010119 [Wickerhamomyces pijperi]|uniref:Arrestin-like N-terminal domain-containing protein n=1 Tax=Wickerhamomyces pijperi TaxID=599730 RepID=A0A9P8PIA8_WICPI|nr:hypothetical protein WICPIJ_010119 [Wickerhamomyces pijperi]